MQGLKISHDFIPERASMSLIIAAIVLPTLFFIFSLSLDLHSYLTMQNYSQKVLDETGLYSYRFLRAGPVQGEDPAVLAAKSYLLRYKSIGAFTTVKREGDVLVLEYQGRAPLFFANFLSKNTSNDSKDSSPSLYLPVNARTRVRGSVFDSVVVVDRSYYLAPGLWSEDHKAWGDSNSWEGSSLFESDFPIVLQSEPSKITVGKRVATQQCFNPIFSSLKLAAANLFIALQSYSLNNTAIVFYPSLHGHTSVLRRLWQKERYPEASFQEEQNLFFEDSAIDSSSDEASSGSSPIVENRHCAAVSEDTSSPRHYWFPERQGSADNPLGGKPSMISSKDWTYNAFLFDSQLRASEVIWSRAVMQGTQNHAELNFAGVLDDLVSVVFELGSNEARGGLRNRALKNIFIFSGDVPRYKNIRFGDQNDLPLRTSLKNSIKRYGDLLEHWNKRSAQGGDPSSLSIYYIIYHTTTSPFAIEESRISKFRSFLKEASLINEHQSSFFNIQLIRTENLNGIENELLNILLLKQKSGVLSW
ncbi:MAG: hypothetical protein GYA55_05355 [SAR324 cluster bacterium]|uniref:Uncharacterized protein n=1 Tax=SAR324 cluster bacterium TaxID=2024889 RepID=A0A7X9IJZ4_9DELT|nr:hypothetical protein [SAR324 cluster bacterium]